MATMIRNAFMPPLILALGGGPAELSQESLRPPAECGGSFGFLNSSSHWFPAMFVPQQKRESRSMGVKSRRRLAVHFISSEHSGENGSLPSTQFGRSGRASQGFLFGARLLIRDTSFTPAWSPVGIGLLRIRVVRLDLRAIDVC